MRNTLILATAVALLAGCGSDSSSIRFERAYEYGDSPRQNAPSEPRAFRRGPAFDSEVAQRHETAADNAEKLATFNDLSADVWVRFWAPPFMLETFNLSDENNDTIYYNAHHAASGRIVVYHAEDGPRLNMDLDLDEDPTRVVIDDYQMETESIQANGIPTNLFREAYDPSLSVSQSDWFAAARGEIYARENELFRTCGNLVCRDSIEPAGIDNYTSSRNLPEIAINYGNGWRLAAGVGTVYVGEERGFGAGRIHIDDIQDPDDTTHPYYFAGGPNGGNSLSGYGYDILFNGQLADSESGQ